MDFKRSKQAGHRCLRLVDGSDCPENGWPETSRTRAEWPPELNGDADAFAGDLAAGQTELERVLDLIREIPDIELLRVHRLRREVRNGVYHPDLERIADALMEEALGTLGES